MSTSAQVASDRTSAAVWLQTMRVKSLLISTFSVAAGAAVAWWEGHTSPMLALAWLAAVAAQAGTNLINVSYNYKAGTGVRPGALVDPRGSSAPVRAGLLTAEQVRRGALVCFAISVAAGAMLAWRVDPRLLWLGVPGLFAGYFYAAPPLRLAYVGLGVITVFAFMGPAMVAGSYWVAVGRVSAGAWAAAVAVGLTAAAVMHVNDVRDFAGDVAHGKRTLSTMIGRAGASWLMALMLVGAYASIVAAAATRVLPPAALAVLLSAPLAVRMTRLVFVERDPVRLNEAWFLGVKLHTAFGALLVGALLMATIIEA
jgi:1,4-dihydroxy-2-naphthoate octaprenyltransferase